MQAVPVEREAIRVVERRPGEVDVTAGTDAGNADFAVRDQAVREQRAGDDQPVGLDRLAARVRDDRAGQHQRALDDGVGQVDRGVRHAAFAVVAALDRGLVLVSIVRIDLHDAADQPDVVPAAHVPRLEAGQPALVEHQAEQVRLAHVRRMLEAATLEPEQELEVGPAQVERAGDVGVLDLHDRRVRRLAPPAQQPAGAGFEQFGGLDFVPLVRDPGERVERREHALGGHRRTPSPVRLALRA